MHNVAFEALGINACYIALDVEANYLKEALAAIRALNIAGVNITIPHKQTCMKYLDKIDTKAKNIGAVNTLLGDCSTTAKSVQFTVDGVSNYATFALDYSNGGALGNHAALITALQLTAVGVTATSSDAANVTLTSDSTGAASEITITADTTGLFLAPVYTAGVAESETIKVTVPEVVGAEDYKVWRSVDGGTVYLYRLMTDAEIQQVSCR